MFFTAVGSALKSYTKKAPAVLKALTLFQRYPAKPLQCTVFLILSKQDGAQYFLSCLTSIVYK
jgi:hypothetical protein